MFNIGPMELIVIAIVGIIFIGPDKLPEVLKKFGRIFVQVKRHANEVKGSFDQVMQDAERELELERIRELQKKLEAISPHQIIDTMVEDKSSPHPQQATQTPALPEAEFDHFHKDAHPHDPLSHESREQLADGAYDPFAPENLQKGHRDLQAPDSLPSASPSPASELPQETPKLTPKDA